MPTIKCQADRLRSCYPNWGEILVRMAYRTATVTGYFYLKLEAEMAKNALMADPELSTNGILFSSYFS